MKLRELLVLMEKRRAADARLVKQYGMLLYTRTAEDRVRLEAHIKTIEKEINDLLDTDIS